MKRFISFISIFILIFSFCITAFSFRIDGSEDNVEWEDSDIVVLLSSEESNCKIDFGSVKWFFDDGSLFICFNFYETDFNDSTQNIGVSFSIEDSDYYTFETEDSSVFDSDKYRVEAAMLYDGAYGAVCEARVGFKHGMPPQIDGKVRFVDTEGSYSNVYQFSIDNDSYEDDYYVPETPAEKPAKTTSTKPATTKQTTAKAEKTTENKTTSSSKTTTKSNENNFDWLDILLETQAPKTTKEKTTKEKTTKVKTTKEKTTKAKSEKKTKANVAKTSEVIENNIASDINPSSTNVIQTVYIVQTEYISQSAVSTSDGKKYQMLTAIAGAITLVTVAVLGTYGANKKANNKSTDTKEDNE